MTFWIQFILVLFQRKSPISFSKCSFCVNLDHLLNLEHIVEIFWSSCCALSRKIVQQDTRHIILDAASIHPPTKTFNKLSDKVWDKTSFSFYHNYPSGLFLLLETHKIISHGPQIFILGHFWACTGLQKRINYSPKNEIKYLKT